MFFKPVLSIRTGSSDFSALFLYLIYCQLYKLTCNTLTSQRIIYKSMVNTEYTLFSFRESDFRNYFAVFVFFENSVALFAPYCFISFSSLITSLSLILL